MPGHRKERGTQVGGCKTERKTFDFKNKMCCTPGKNVPVKLSERAMQVSNTLVVFDSPEDFELIPELAMNPVGGRIIGAFFPPRCS